MAWRHNIKVMQSVPSFGNAALARVGMLNINYERSPLSQQFSKDATRHARSGWYVLDVGCRLGNQPVALFDIIRGPQATLLLFAGVSPTNETVEAIRQSNVRSRRLTDICAFISSLGQKPMQMQRLRTERKRLSMAHNTYR
jgi:hypothetical protein